MESKPDTWRRRSSKKVADCRVFTVRENDAIRESDGQEGKFFVIENPDWVNVIALTPGREVVLIDQFRHGIERTILEIPGGMVDDGENPLAAAKRELVEETGYTSDNWRPLGTSHPNPAIQNNRIFHFLAVDCVKTSAPEFDEHESIVVRLESLKTVRDLIASGTIDHSLVIAAVYFLWAQADQVTES